MIDVTFAALTLQGLQKYLPIALVAIAGLLLIAGLARALKNKRAAKKAAAPAVSGGSGITAARVRSVWRAFLRQIPREFRRSVLAYQHFVVLGESGAGKSLLI